MASQLHGVLRNARPDDQEDLLRFFERAADPNVLPRPAEDYRRSVDNGLFYLLEIDNGLVAAGGVFALHEHDMSPLEMGSCYVVPFARGFGIQKLLVRLRIAAAIILLDESAEIYTSVKPGNKESKANVLSAGFQPLIKVVPLLVEPCANCQFRPSKSANRVCCCDFYYLPRQRQCQEIQMLLKSDAAPASRKNGDKIFIDMQVQVLTNREYRAALEEFVSSAECDGNR